MYQKIKEQLPKEFITELYSLFSPAIVDKIIISYHKKKKTTFRVNTLKITKRELIEKLKKENIKINLVSFIENAFFLESDLKKLINSNIYKEGLIYLQSLSSMLPPIILSPQPGEKVLDIAASPGSKTTQIASLMNNIGTIDAIEPDFIRMERLKYNCNLQGAKIVNFFKIRGELIDKEKINYYDKVLVDAPCSGEGTLDFLNNPLKKIKNRKKYANLQYKLLKRALLSVKKGGIIIYSTCTLNYLENEGVVNRLLNESEISFNIEEVTPFIKEKFEELYPAFTQINDIKFHPDLKKAIRILPSDRMEGFFICRLRKI